MDRTDKLAHRKSQCIIHASDEQGKPISHAKLRIQQSQHSFLFGCGAFDFVDYVTCHNDNEKQKLADRTSKWLAVYNYATLPFYWGRYEPTEGKPEENSRMSAAHYLRDQNVKVKGHPLCWHTVCADWLMEYDNDTILRKQLERINRDVSHFKGIIDMWDVINEVVIMPVFNKYDNAITRICKDKGRISLVREVFAAAKKANPNAVLLINDFNTSAAYEILIEGCLEAGIPITAIGIQSHQHQGYWGRQKLESILERYERFKIPIHFTENTLVSGPLIPPEIEDLNDFHYEDGVSTPEFEERQKNETEEMYRILFDHPLVEAITGWDFTDGAWLNAPSGVLHKDNTEKPVYTMLKDLIRHEWWTDYEVMTDDSGNAEVYGFKGDYIASTMGKSASFCIGNDSTCRLSLRKEGI